MSKFLKNVWMWTASISILISKLWNCGGLMRKPKPCVIIAIEAMGFVSGIKYMLGIAKKGKDFI